MKTRIFLIVAFLLLNCLYSKSKEASSGGSDSLSGSINVTTSPELYDLTMKWANEYSRLNPTQKITVSKASENTVSEIISSGELGIVSEEFYHKLNNSSTRSMVVGRDVIVPVMSSKNPLLNEICLKGITTKDLSQIISNPENKSWGDLIGGAQKTPIHFYTANDQSAVSVLRSLQNLHQPFSTGIQTAGTAEMILAIQNDPNALGFFNLTQIADPNNKNLLEGLRFVPIDKNGNGKIDYMENIYTDIESFSRGVWIGKYPKALTSNIYSVSSSNPNNTSEVAFLKWVLTDGQSFLNENGYSNLVYNERLAQLGKFGQPDLYATVPVERTSSLLSVLLLILVFIVITGVVVELVFRAFRKRSKASHDFKPVSMGVFNEESVIIPKGLYFGKTHSWAFMKKNGSVKIGIDDFLQHITGTITRVELKRAGETVKKGELLMSIIRKGKLLNIYSPISGTITEVNENLEYNSSLLNSSPYSEGWVYLIEPLNWGLEIQYLLIAEKYKEALKDEFARLKDFFTSLIKANSLDFAYVTMQDGGELTDNPLAELEPEVWDDFQTKFIDASK
ncbi:glycine cleavage system H protein [Aquipluma nitroreducens]|uniref:Glycine cleavage system H protein n=1 Tax=Aquipluma nitroreducens TaxID=2010828 RepID=A0A5K7SDV4_9BACT|nr:substrate-binding domain-containing protein [Aquipluma nitroreducens]BBE19792.1 glycine cleavage system H protein [Aquipluma nitroreducens]